MRRKCGLHHGRRNHSTPMIGALSAADVPSDRRHPRIPPFSASACTDIRVRRLCHPASPAVYYRYSSIWLRMQSYCVRPVYIIYRSLFNNLW